MPLHAGQSLRHRLRDALPPRQDQPIEDLVTEGVEREVGRYQDEAAIVPPIWPRGVNPIQRWSEGPLRRSLAILVVGEREARNAATPAALVPEVVHILR